MSQEHQDQSARYFRSAPGGRETGLEHGARIIALGSQVSFYLYRYAAYLPNVKVSITTFAGDIATDITATLAPEDLRTIADEFTAAANQVEAEQEEAAAGQGTLFDEKTSSVEHVVEPGLTVVEPS